MQDRFTYLFTHAHPEGCKCGEIVLPDIRGWVLFGVPFIIIF